MRGFHKYEVKLVIQMVVAGLCLPSLIEGQRRALACEAPEEKVTVLPLQFMWPRYYRQH